MKTVLAIGNSFSQDACYYLHEIGETAGVPNRVVNLYIGGCPLETHWENIRESKRAYQVQINGRRMDRYVSVQDMLRECRFDAFVTQQSSYDSGWADSYEPFLGEILEFLASKAPGVPLYLHKTWAYGEDCTHEKFPRYSNDTGVMHERLSAAYGAMAEKYHLPVIPCGDVIAALRQTEAFGEKGLPITRDGYHMNYLYGRYALGLTWAAALWNTDPAKDRYVPSTDYMPWATADPEILTLIRGTVCDIMNQEK